MIPVEKLPLIIAPAGGTSEGRCRSRLEERYAIARVEKAAKDLEARLLPGGGGDPGAAARVAGKRIRSNGIGNHKTGKDA